MVMAQSLSDVAINQLSAAERLDLIRVLWDTIPDSLEELPIPDWRREELERRLAAADVDPDGAIPWEELSLSDFEKPAGSRSSVSYLHELGSRPS
jgi:putative addiction module component (TIGR02574 family)